MGMNERRVSARKEVEGVPAEYDGFRVTLARAGGHNKAYLKVLEDCTKPVRKALEMGFVSDDKAKEWFKLAYAKAVITNWEVYRDGKWIVGIDDPDYEGSGEAPVIPFNYDNVLRVIRDERYHDYFDDFVRLANDPRLYREMQQEADIKN